MRYEAKQVIAAPIVLSEKKMRLCADIQLNVLQKYAINMRPTPIVPIQSLKLMVYTITAQNYCVIAVDENFLSDGYLSSISRNSVCRGDTAGSKYPSNNPSSLIRYLEKFQLGA